MQMSLEMASSAVESNEDSVVWDELSNQHSIEIRQHCQRTKREGQKIGILHDVFQRTKILLSAQKDTDATSMSTATPGGQSSDPLGEFGLGSPSSSLPGRPYGSTFHAPLLSNDYQQQQHHHYPTAATDATGYGGGNDDDDENSHHFHKQSQQNRRTDYILLRKFRLFSDQDGWGAVSNLDLFFTSIYNYYYHRGIAVIFGKGLVEIFSLFVTLCLSVVLFACLDWRKLSECVDESTCEDDLREYFVEKPLRDGSAWDIYNLVYIILFSCYGLVRITSFVETLNDASTARSFYEERLGISQAHLEGGAIEWDTVVEQMRKLQDSGEYRIVLHGQQGADLDALTVAQRILRKENFLVAMINRGDILDLSLPWWRLWPSSSSSPRDHSHDNYGGYFSKSIEWSIHFCVLGYMFNHKHEIRPSFYMDPSALKRRFILLGIAYVVFMPFLLVFMVLHFLFLNVQDWKSSQKYVGPKEWSNGAKWTFREFNELPHVFERRLSPSYAAAEDFQSLIPRSAVMTSLGQAVVFVSGAFLALLLALGTVNDNLLKEVNLGHWTLFWYFGIFGVLYSGGRALLVDNKDKRQAIHRNRFREMDAALSRVASSTHHMPESWRGRAWQAKVQSEFGSMWTSQAVLFGREMWSLAVVTPIVLVTSLADSSHRICDFVRAVRMERPGVGHICGYSSFDFRAYGDNGRGGGGGDNGDDKIGTMLSASSSVPKTRRNKMEQSFFSFKAAHPSWKCDATGQNLVERVEEFRKEQTLSLIARERHCRIEAAARELELLGLWETSTPNISTMSKMTTTNTKLKTQEDGNNDVDNAIPSSAPMVVDNHVAPPFSSLSAVQEPHHAETQDGVVSGEDDHDNNNNNAILSSPGSASASASIVGHGNLSVLDYADTSALSGELRRVLRNNSVLGGVSLHGLNLDLGSILLNNSVSAAHSIRSSLASSFVLGAQLNNHRSRLYRREDLSRTVVVDEEDEEEDEAENSIEDEMQASHFWLNQYHSHVSDMERREER